MGTNKPSASKGAWASALPSQQPVGPVAPRVGLLWDFLSGLLLLGIVSAFSWATLNFGFVDLVGSMVRSILAEEQAYDQTDVIPVLAWFTAWGVGALALTYLGTYRAFRKQRILAEVAALVYRSYNLDEFDILRATSAMPSIPRPHRIKGHGWVFAYRLSSALDVPAEKYVGLKIYLPPRRGRMLVLFQPDEASPIQALVKGSKPTKAHLIK